MTFTCAKHGKFYKIDFCPHCPASAKAKTRGRSTVSATADEWLDLATYLQGDVDNMDFDNTMKPTLRRWCGLLHKAAARAQLK